MLWKFMQLWSRSNFFWWIIYLYICSFAVGFYILLRAVDRFAVNYNRFPGIFDGYVWMLWFFSFVCVCVCVWTSVMKVAKPCQDGFAQRSGRGHFKIEDYCSWIIERPGIPWSGIIWGSNQWNVQIWRCRAPCSCCLHRGNSFPRSNQGPSRVLLLSSSSKECSCIYGLFQLVTKQFVPLTGTFIFNGIDQKSQALAL